MLSAADGGGGTAAAAPVAAGPAPTRPRFASCEEVHEFLELAGVPNPKRVNACLKAGMLGGYVKCPPADSGVDAAKAWLDDIILEDDCILCGASHTACVRDVLRQPTYAGLDYEDGGQNGAVQCEGCTGMYVTGLCRGKGQLDSGKGHNHCLECPDFGECVGDYRNAHCRRCGDHYFHGSGGQFKCPCRGDDRDHYDPYGDYDDDDDDDDDDADDIAAADSAAIEPRPGCWDGTLVGARDLPRLTADERERERLVEAWPRALRDVRRVASNIERLREANSGGEPAIVTSLDSMCTKTLAIEICESTTLDELRELAIGAKKISTIWDNFVQMMQALQSNRHVDGDQDDDDDMEEDNDEDDDEDNNEDADDEDDENAADDGGDGGCN